ncbi:MAG TPA: biotin transporter BioY [Saprospiraceae bacterium]|nr:biotin transporter BioY [Saprospiraceae bacterium]HMQ83933.1 biotin transporter BioY [Saprospiraceae bacterium]
MKHFLMVVAATGFIALLAQWSWQTPASLGGIPITGQSLAVLVVGMLVQKPYAVLSVGLYLLLGGLGLPIFAEGNSGWSVFAGGSGGFLFGFLAAAFLMEPLALRGWGKRFEGALLAMTLGTAVIIAMGLLRLAWLYDWPRALEYGFYPFWKGALVKIVLGAAIVWFWEAKKKV